MNFLGLKKKQRTLPVSEFNHTKTSCETIIWKLILAPMFSHAITTWNVPVTIIRIAKGNGSTL